MKKENNKRITSFSKKKKEEIIEIKIILLGDPGVGKTNIINRYLFNNFEQSSKPTLGSAFGEKTIKKDGVSYLLKIWDTTGQERYNSITKLFIKGSNIVLLVYSIDNLESFDSLKNWFNYVKAELQRDKYILAIVGNKKDLFENEVISEDEGKEFAKKLNAFFYLVSAKCDANGIENSFNSLLDELILKFGKKTLNETSIRLEEDDINNRGKKCC